MYRINKVSLKPIPELRVCYLTWRCRLSLISTNYLRTCALSFTMPLDLSEMTLEEVLRSYSSVKRHRIRCKKEIANLLLLLTTQYFSTSEVRINDCLEKLEKYMHKLTDIAEYTPRSFAPSSQWPPTMSAPINAQNPGLTPALLSLRTSLPLLLVALLPTPSSNTRTPLLPLPAAFRAVPLPTRGQPLFP